MHRDCLSAQLHGVQRILHSLIDRDIARNDSDRLYLDIRMLHRHHKRDRIVRGSVGINKETTSHISPIMRR
jgi:hypothetical protein